MDVPVWVALAVLLLLGLWLNRSVAARATAFADPTGTLRLSYPAHWLAVPGSPHLLDVQDPLSGGGVATRLIVTREDRAPDRTVSQAADETILSRSQELAMYRVLAQREVAVGGRDGLAIEYAFVADPHEAVLAAQRIPVVVRGVEALVPTDGVLYHVDLRATVDRFAQARATFEDILRGVRF